MDKDLIDQSYTIDEKVYSVVTGQNGIQRLQGPKEPSTVGRIAKGFLRSCAKVVLMGIIVFPFAYAGANLGVAFSSVGASKRAPYSADQPVVESSTMGMQTSSDLGLVVDTTTTAPESVEAVTSGVVAPDNPYQIKE